jgi:hypothetical protein
VKTLLTGSERFQVSLIAGILIAPIGHEWAQGRWVPRFLNGSHASVLIQLNTDSRLSQTILLKFMTVNIGRFQN